MSRTERRCWIAGRLAWAVALSVSFAGAAYAADGLPKMPTDKPGAVDLVINSETKTNDTETALAVLNDGRAIATWHAYRDRKDRIFARTIGPGQLGPIHELTEKGGACGRPTIAPYGNAGAWVFWPSLEDNNWRILGRQLVGDRWKAAVEISDGAADSFTPSALAIGNSRLAVAWSAAKGDGTLEIRARLLEDDRWAPAVNLSSSDFDAYRPVLAVKESGETWAFWDRYVDGNYRIEGRQVLPELGPVERVSPPEAYAITPTAIADRRGLLVAWLQLEDVVAAPGVIDQMHTLRAARRTADGWKMVPTADGDTAAATLTHGIMVEMLPKPLPKLGYMGRCRVPMLLKAGDETWLLWDRKKNPPGHPARSTGQLIGRPLRGGSWQEPVVLHDGLIFYCLPQAAAAVDGQFYFLASQLPRDDRRTFHARIGDFAKHTAFSQAKWQGWEPIHLPLSEEDRQRNTIELDGHDKPYQLFWADLHNHSTHTCDAEGEIDELLHYARDRSRIDVVALTDNDDIFDAPLTEGEYALTTYFARRFSRGPAFLALPGYEWTSHIPRDPKYDRSDPRNWDFEWHIRNSRNDHRTVLYPLAGGPLIRHTEIHNDIKAMFDIVRSHGGVAMPQHESWQPVGDPVEVGMEVASAWGMHMRNPGNFHNLLNRGYRYAIMAHSDSHRRNPGLGGALTGIYAEALTDTAILDALKHRRIYATSGSKIVVDARANGHIMGEEFDSPDGHVELQLFAEAPRRIVKAALIRGGKTIAEFPGDGSRTIRAVHREDKLPKGTHWYYWSVQQEGDATQFHGNASIARGPFAWSSPHWVTVP